jgi:hypothetical protein
MVGNARKPSTGDILDQKAAPRTSGRVIVIVRHIEWREASTEPFPGVARDG